MIKGNEEAIAFCQWLFAMFINSGDRALVSRDLVKTLQTVVEWAGMGEALNIVDPGTTVDLMGGLLDASRERDRVSTTYANQLTANCMLDIAAPLMLDQRDVPVTHVFRMLLKHAGLERDIRVRRKGRVVRIRSVRSVGGARFRIDLHLAKYAVDAERDWDLRN